MNRDRSALETNPSTPYAYGYILLIFGLALTGFAQMPIFKRYYVADIPGLGWLAEFFTTHYLHYIGAIALLGVATYVATDYLLTRRRRFHIGLQGSVQAVFLAGSMISGAFLVVRNLPGVHFPAWGIIVLDLAHLGFAVAFLACAVVCGILKKKWTITNKRHI